MADAAAPLRDPIEPPAPSRPTGEVLARLRARPPADHAHWHDGIGHDLDALAVLAPAAREAVTSALVPPADARDVEALAVLDTGPAREALCTAARSGSLDVRLAVLRHAPACLDDAARTALVRQAIVEARPFASLAATLDAILSHHPPPIVDAVRDALLVVPGAVAYHYAAILSVLCGVAESEYDMTQRPRWLAVQTDDPVARRDAVRAFLAELDAACAR